MNSHTINHTEDILEDIKSNTATLSNINLNTDGLETKLDTVATNQTNGTQQVKIMGLSTDGSQEQIGTDNNNNVKVNVINAVNVLPHHSTGSTSTFNTNDSNTQSKLDTVNTNLTNITNNTSPINDLELHASALDTNTVLIRDNIASMKIFSQDSELHLSAIDTNISNRLPSSLGAKSEALSLSIARNNDTGTFDNFCRTNITDRGTSTALLCDNLGRQITKSNQNITNDSVVNYFSSQSVGASSSHVGSAISVSPSVRNILIVHNFSSTDLSFTLQASLDGVSYIDTDLSFNSGGGMGGLATLSGITNIQGISSMGGTGFTPFIKFVLVNGTGGALTGSLDYMIQNF